MNLFILCFRRVPHRVLLSRSPEIYQLTDKNCMTLSLDNGVAPTSQLQRQHHGVITNVPFTLRSEEDLKGLLADFSGTSIIQPPQIWYPILGTSGRRVLPTSAWYLHWEWLGKQTPSELNILALERAMKQVT